MGSADTAADSIITQTAVATAALTTAVTTTAVATTSSAASAAFVVCWLDERNCHLRRQHHSLHDVEQQPVSAA